MNSRQLEAELRTRGWTDFRSTYTNLFYCVKLKALRLYCTECGFCIPTPSWLEHFLESRSAAKPTDSNPEQIAGETSPTLSSTDDSELDAALAASLVTGDLPQAATTGVPAVPPTPVSQHVNEATGDFSIEVLGQALSQHGAWLLNTEHETVVVQVMEAPEAEQAFLCHRRGHWFALRALCGMWWSLDSTLKHPQLIPPPLLATFLAVQRAEGHTVHVLRGTPLPLPQLSRQSLSAGRDDVWHPIDRLIESQASAGGGAANTALSETYERLVLGEGGRTTHEEDVEAVKGGLAGLSGGDSDLDAALAASLAAEDQLHGATLAAPPRAPPPLPGAPPVSVPMLLGMGFSWGQVHHALEATGDLHLAQEMLLQQRAALMIPGPD